ncbi:conserved hypothetical protein [Culex quinquefasciatus]|uniref:SBF1/SBF2 domain-containing protein n=2 Tax=Culex quinquefasciatus TaxID=7176 RepID=B0WIC1_CULQU|nr:conserved hypothetical protein [Culex quinquefasciatus]|eukprot:XP_001848455.1 conserved hypothetical protein [Culex quinquefasciatus]
MDIAAFASTMATKAAARDRNRDRVSQPHHDLTSASGEMSGSMNGGTAAAATAANSDVRANKLKSFMGKTPSAIKSKFLSVLGNSTEIINGISNKIDAALSLSSSEDTETTETRNQAKVDKMLRQKYEASSWKHPATLNGSNGTQPVPINDRPPSNSISTEFSHSNYSNNSCSIDSKSPQPPPDGVECDQAAAAVEVASKSVPAVVEAVPSGKDHYREPKLGISASTSDNESCVLSATLESSELKMWIRSESENSVPSWASSISLDSQSEEAILDFMKRFVKILFRESGSITLELKSDFGQYARTETGRLWFSRLVNAQRAKSKRVDESTFYSLIQNFAIVLFECAESEDFSPAKTLMNMCFTFYHDIDVPGCEPYREYLYTYLRDQPIWHSLRFWNAAFFDALQTERKHHPVPPTKGSGHVGMIKGVAEEVAATGASNNVLVVPENERSSSTSACDRTDPFELLEDKKYHQNLSFGQLGSFTCNMHAFGLGRELCYEFLMKQCVIANLTFEQQKLLKDNVDRMYRETDPWREN